MTSADAAAAVDVDDVDVDVASFMKRRSSDSLTEWSSRCLRRRDDGFDSWQTFKNLDINSG